MLAPRPQALPLPMKADYKIQFGTEIAARIGRCRASVRAAVEEALHSIAVTAGANKSRATASLKKGPSMRFYVYEGYRIFYQLDPRTRRVVVLDFGVVPAA
jgi:mRNA-degrading endonuclease RelE of RelBE toxin-antitoxin system